MSENNCRQAAGVITPHIDRNRCEGKADCVVVCPVNVFAVQTLPKVEREGLSLRGKLKGFVHGWQQAVLLNPGACEACGLCVQACPEKAIHLVRAENNHSAR
ncbi:MAG TPA: ferredoxin family protein [Cellvibrio sp.]|nr:ferredoxin family protein [Cellvibrio sp.]